MSLICLIFALLFAGGGLPKGGAEPSAEERVCAPSDPVEIMLDPHFQCPDGLLSISFGPVGEVFAVRVLEGPTPVPAGRYSAVYIQNGYLVAADTVAADVPGTGPSVPSPNPVGCSTVISVPENGVQTISCAKIGCTEPCALYSEINSDGVRTKFYCFCNKAVPNTEPTSNGQSPINFQFGPPPP